MRRLLMIAAFTAALAVPCAWAQRRGGSFGGGHMGGGAHFGSFSHAPVMMNRGPAFSAAHRSYGVHFTTSWGNPYHYGHGYRHHRFRYYGSYYPYYPYYASYGYGLYGYDPFLWGSPSSYDDTSDQYLEENQQLSQQVNELSNEVERLRDEAQIRAYTPLPTNRQAEPQPSAKADISATTVLVFRDKHREEISNYAVVGHTLWIFNQDRAKKIPLAELDLPATAKVNDDRGVDFSIPR
jgi:hypothetical protein